MILDGLRNLFDSQPFMPHGHCYLWRPDILWLNVIPDTLIAISYYIIPIFLVYIVRKRQDLAFNWIFVMFALFIVACGTTHIMDIWTVWYPNYAAQGFLKLFTALISVATAVLLWPLTPKVLALPSSRQLEQKTDELEHVNAELKRVNATLEDRVLEKTRALANFAAIVQFSNDAIIGNDMNGVINAWNPAAERMFGYSASEAIGKSILMLIPQNDRYEFSKVIERIKHGDTIEAADTVRLTKEWRQVSISLTVSPIKDAAGQIIGSSSIARDVSSRKLFEERLQKSEARKAAVLEASLEAIVTIDHEGTVVEWNAAAEQTFGYSRKEATGKELANLVIPERFRESHRNGILRYLTTSKGPIIGQRIEVSARRANGDEFPLEISLAVIPGSNSLEPPLFTASARDITKRVQAEEALKRNEERLRKVIEGAPNGILMIDRYGNIVLCNAEFESLFGYARHEIVGHPIEILVPERFRANHPRNRTEYFRAPSIRQMGVGRDLFGLRKDGKEFPVEIGLSPLEMDGNTFILATVVDITMRKALEDRLRKSSKSIQQKNLEMEQFVYTVSHDLKSPLVTSTGFLGLLKEDVLAGRNEKLMDSISRLERANTRMSQLIDDLLQLSRLGRISLEPDRVEVSAIMRSIQENLAKPLAEKNAHLVVQDNMPTVRADRKRVYQVFENLIINALKYGCDETHREIAVGSLTTGDEIRFFVRDNGPGIPEEYHQKIFGLFQRLEADNRGTGVGLTIVARVMQLHGGRVWVESSPGHGATFWLAFPIDFSPSGGPDDE